MAVVHHQRHSDSLAGLMLLDGVSGQLVASALQDLTRLHRGCIMHTYNQLSVQ
jgi:hypothetical protein